MKKFVKELFVFILMLIVPLAVFADEEAYEYFDFKVDRVEGENINNTEIRIYASKTQDPDNLTDRTEEFNIVEKMWSVCVSLDCATVEEVSDDAVFEDGKEYVLMIRLSAINEADINVWGTDRAKYNGTPIEELSGEYGNTGNELMIKTKTNVSETIIPDDVVETPAPTSIIEPKEKKEEVDDNDKCLLGLSFCCTTFLGLSICIWILIVLLIILLIVIFFALRNKKKTDEQLAQL